MQKLIEKCLQKQLKNIIVILLIDWIINLNVSYFPFFLCCTFLRSQEFDALIVIIDSFSKG